VAIEIIPYLPEHEQAVYRFNARLASGGIHYRFPVSAKPTRFPHVDPHTPGLYDAGSALCHDIYVALDNEQEVRGGFLLQYQDFLVNGERLSLSNYQIPLSEGIIDKQYGFLGLTLIKKATAIQPYLFGLGIGGFEEGSAKLMKALRWGMTTVPFWFRIVHPFKFLRNISHLRKTPLRRLTLDLAAFSGAGWVGARGYNLLKSRLDRTVRVEIVPDFDGRVNDVWERSHKDYTVIAIRDFSLLRRMYPADDERFHRLYVYRGERLLGWVVCMDTRFANHKHFGGMRLGSIVDGLCPTEDAAGTISAATRYLAGRGVDLIVSNQANRFWGEGLRSAGFIQGPSNFLFTASPALAAKIVPFEQVVADAHLNRGDADGPLHL